MEETLLFFNKARELINTMLKQYMANDEFLLKLLQESIDYSLFSDGKRLRPIFCLTVGELFDVPRDMLIATACATEMIHTASLIMDDLPHMDDGKFRRGKAANHLVYGQDVATLASIGLLTKAYELVLEDPLLPEDKKIGTIIKLVKSVGLSGMVGGQFVDLKFANKLMEYGTLEYIHNHKTASLFVASGSAAAYIGNANKRDTLAVEDYAKNLGFAFQAKDDLLDATGTVHEIGKSPQRDKGNFLTFYSSEECRQHIAESTKKAIDAVRIFEGKNTRIIEFAGLIMKHK
jgi:geranylgeranyl diphosphate synthase type II